VNLSVLNELPAYAKDVRLTAEAALTRSSLSSEQAYSAAIGAAFATGNQRLVDALNDSSREAITNTALTAAALMAMTNAYYTFVDSADVDELKAMRSELRMTAYANYVGDDKVLFELAALGASIVGRCKRCVSAHSKLLLDNGLTVQNLRDVGRIAACVGALAKLFG